MALGLSPTLLGDKWLNTLGGAAGAGTTFTAISSFAKLHVVAGDPGVNGTANASANTTRVAMLWAAASGGVKAIQATFPVWASWASGSETIAHVSVWDTIGPAGGNFMYSFTLTVAKPMTNGDTLTLSAHSFTLTPLAA
jgi:hypothetical protein